MILTSEIDDSGVSCGVMMLPEVATISDHEFIESVNYRPEKGFDPFNVKAWDIDYNDAPFQKGYSYIFSDAVKFGNGRRIAALIKKHKLGTLVKTRAATNPNSGNKIETWIWRYNGKKVKV
jgi:hypothetical protein